jgi:hypothetical protein
MWRGRICHKLAVEWKCFDWLIMISQLKQHMKIKFLFKPGKSAAETLYNEFTETGRTYLNMPRITETEGKWVGQQCQGTVKMLPELT